MKPKALAGILLANLTVFAVFLLLGEISYRLLRFAKSCTKECEFSHFSIITQSQRNKWFMGISSYSQYLGYEPSRNLDLVINAPGWKNIKVSTDHNGFRTSHPSPSAEFKILTVGDSFTWGDQVSDRDTWQSCLNKKFQDLEFVNAGVFGYGTYQALMRSQEITKTNQYKYVILQTLVGHDFERDRLDIRSGFVKPYLKKSNGNVVVSPPPPKSTPNTKYGRPYMISPIDYLVANINLLDRIPKINLYRKNVLSRINGDITRHGMDSATVEKIIDHTVNASSNQKVPFIWLLQYTSAVDKNILDERMSIIRRLKSRQIPFIDTFNALHVSKKHSPDQLWFGHHTPLGNKVVCQEIAYYFKSRSIKH